MDRMMPKPKIRSTYESFVMLNTVIDFDITPEMRRLMSGPWRVWTVSLNRLNNWNHAPFRPAELAMLVYGEDTEQSRAKVRDWIRKLATMGWIASHVKDVKQDEIGSSPLCVVVNKNIAERKAGRASDFVCSEPTHMDCRKQSWPTAAESIAYDERDTDDSDDDYDAWNTPGLGFSAPTPVSDDEGTRNRYDRSLFQD
jgi:hypothetical protein